MDHQIFLQYIQTLGFPVCVSVALAWALWKIGSQLLSSHFKIVDRASEDAQLIIEELKVQSSIMRKWPSDPVQICKAEEVTKALNTAAHR